MELKDLLIASGITAEQTDAVLAGMKENKLFITDQENLDIRYEKLKAKHEDLTTQMTTANSTIEDLQKNNLDNTALQAALDKYKTDFDSLQTESEKKIKDMTINTQIKAYMKECKVKDKYDDLLMSKIDRSALELDANGTVAGLDEIFTGFRTEYADLFTAKLEGTPPNNSGSSTDNLSAMTEAIKASISLR